jgi:hypothetical protein
LAGQRSSGVPGASCLGLQEFGDQLFSTSSRGQLRRGPGVREVGCSPGQEIGSSGGDWQEFRSSGGGCQEFKRGLSGDGSELTGACCLSTERGLRVRHQELPRVKVKSDASSSGGEVRRKSSQRMDDDNSLGTYSLSIKIV